MKKYISTITLCVLILSACGAKQNITNKIENKTENKLTSIKDLMGLGKEQVCEWSLDTDGTKSSGKLWIKGKKFRQTAMTQIKDQPEIKMEIVTDGEWTYLWNPDSKEQGMKMRVTEEQKADTQKLANGSLDWGKQFNYNCSPTFVSDADMTPPKDIKFMDLEALQDQFKKLIPSGTQIPSGE